MKFFLLLAACVVVGSALEEVPSWGCAALSEDLPAHDCPLVIEAASRAKLCDELSSRRDELCETKHSKRACEGATKDHASTCQDRKVFQWSEDNELLGEQDVTKFFFSRRRRTIPTAVTQHLSAIAKEYTDSWASGKDVNWCINNKHSWSKWTQGYNGQYGWFVAGRNGVNTITNQDGITVRLCGAYATVCADPNLWGVSSSGLYVAGHRLDIATCGTSRIIAACEGQSSNGVMSLAQCDNTAWELPLL